MQFLETKVPPPLVGLIAAGLMWLVARQMPGLDFHLPWPSLAPIVAAAGLLISAAGVITFRRARTTPNPFTPAAATTLVQSGPYRFTRNPMYVGVTLVLTGWGLQLGNMAALVPVAAFVLYIDRFQIVPEERALTGVFGQAYADYKARVRRWL